MTDSHRFAAWSEGFVRGWGHLAPGTSGSQEQVDSSQRFGYDAVKRFEGARGQDR